MGGSSLFAPAQGINRVVPDVTPGGSGHDLSMSEFSNGGARRLYRNRKGQVVAGVCAGLAEYFKVDANLVRLAFAVLSVFGGLGVLLYLIAWIILPEEGEDASIAESFINKQRRS
jgi:phage shock protein PspC (stress-responsive transcriptional regulator)